MFELGGGSGGRPVGRFDMYFGGSLPAQIERGGYSD